MLTLKNHHLLLVLLESLDIFFTGASMLILVLLLFLVGRDLPPLCNELGTVRNWLVPSSSFMKYFASPQNNANEVAGFFGLMGASGRFIAATLGLYAGAGRGAGGISPLS